MSNLKIGDLIEVTIDKVIFGGEGLTRIDNFTIFVPMSVPGDQLKIEIISVKKSYARGLIREIIKPSVDRIKDITKMTFEDFNGCDFAMMDYKSQLKYKDKIAIETIEKLSGESIVDKYETIISSEINENYRNKTAEPLFKEKGIIKSGFYNKKSHDLFEAENNVLSSIISQIIIKKFLEKVNNLNGSKKEFSVYNERSNSGFLKHIIVRNNEKNDAMLIIVVNKKPQLKNLLMLLEEFYHETEELKSVYVSIKTEENNVILGEEIRHYFGDKYLVENINDLTFRIYADSFFQINKKQAEKLYNKAISYIENISEKNVVDAFSGTGTIGMLMAEKAKNVYCIESIESSVVSAKETSIINKLNNIKFIYGKVENELEKVVKNNEIDTIVFDPPRKGIEEKALKHIVKANIKEIIYISCNPSTFARDVKILCENGYKLDKISSVDMFSQTHHIEVVGRLTK